MCNLHCITLFALVLNFFALVLHILHSFLSQSELSNFVMYIIRRVICITSKKIYKLKKKESLACETSPITTEKIARRVTCLTAQPWCNSLANCNTDTKGGQFSRSFCIQRIAHANSYHWSISRFKEVFSIFVCLICEVNSLSRLEKFAIWSSSLEFSLSIDATYVKRYETQHMSRLLSHLFRKRVKLDKFGCSPNERSFHWRSTLGDALLVPLF